MLSDQITRDLAHGLNIVLCIEKALKNHRVFRVGEAVDEAGQMLLVVVPFRLMVGHNHSLHGRSDICHRDGLG